MYTFNRMPFGVATAPGWFQFVMTSVLKECLLVVCAVYIDDVIIFANSPRECWVHTVRVISLLTEAGFSISPKKCRFCVTQVTMLGHRFGSGLFRPKEAKLAAL